MKEIIENSIAQYMRDAKDSPGFGMSLLNGGGELTFRGNLLPFIQNELNELYEPKGLNKLMHPHIVVAEYAPTVNGKLETANCNDKKEFSAPPRRKRADLAILECRDENSKPDCVAIIELKLNFTQQGPAEVKKRHDADIEKWKEYDCEKIFVYAIIEIVKNSAELLNCIGKNYIRAATGKTDKQKEIELLFRNSNRVSNSPYQIAVNYPINETVFRTHVFLVESKLTNAKSNEQSQRRSLPLQRGAPPSVLSVEPDSNTQSAHTPLAETAQEDQLQTAAPLRLPSSTAPKAG